ncbi:hypothetical protein PoB_006194500 [Plakobranchus ocellatus]|uniref:Uncharacterized protein n=1 Tax=Plakobranchus ocellatus TaxID=259542 RepID=A0AAV4CUB2_9GAST|nr:hypothetical protein PoB_006194500 [Plakobranchus ocellatus]
MALIEDLGFIVRFDKSVLRPSQPIDHSNFRVDSVSMALKIESANGKNLFEGFLARRTMTNQGREESQFNRCGDNKLTSLNHGPPHGGYTRVAQVVDIVSGKAIHQQKTR